MLEKEVEENISALRKTIRDSPSLQENVYTCIANGCQLLRAYRQTGGAKGWVTMLRGEDGQPFFNYEERQTIEEGFAKARWINTLLNMEDNQTGGGINLPLDVAGGDSKLLTTTSAPLKGSDLSFQAFFEKGSQKVKQLDNFWAEFADGIGVTKLISSDQILPIPGVGPVPVSRRLLERILISFLDTVRYTGALAGEKNTTLTLLVLLEELVTGQWRQMLMTAVGLLSPTGVALGIVFKYIINAWMLIPSATRDALVTDVLDAGQSMFVGFLLWAVVTLPPETVKEPLKIAMNEWNMLLENMKNEMSTMETELNKTLNPLGKKISFAKIDLSSLEGINFSTITNFMNIFKFPLLVCSKEFQNILKALDDTPPLYLLMEMLGAPTTDSKRLKVCGTLDVKPMAEAVKEYVTPDILTLMNDESDNRPEADAAKKETDNTPPAPEANKESENRPPPIAAAQQGGRKRTRKSKRRSTRSPRSRRRGGVGK